MKRIKDVSLADLRELAGFAKEVQGVINCAREWRAAYLQAKAGGQTLPPVQRPRLHRAEERLSRMLKNLDELVGIAPAEVA